MNVFDLDSFFLCVLRRLTWPSGFIDCGEVVEVDVVWNFASWPVVLPVSIPDVEIDSPGRDLGVTSFNRALNRAVTVIGGHRILIVPPAI
jgi:hypothetical protein